MYLGTLRYRDIDFNFGFDGNELVMYPNPEQANTARALIDTNLGNGVWASGTNVLKVEEEYLEVRAKNRNARLVLFYESNYFTRIGFSDASFRIPIADRLEFFSSEKEVDAILLESPLLDYLYNVQRIAGDRTSEEDGFSMNLHPCSLKCGTFLLDDVEVETLIGFSVKSISKEGEFPAGATGYIEFRFEKTRDYNFVRKLKLIGDKFLGYCCRSAEARFDVGETRILRIYEKEDKSIYKYYDKTGYYYSGKPGLLDVPESLERGRFLSIGKYEGLERRILQELANDTLYIRHLPGTFAESSEYDISRVLSTAIAFDWEFDCLFPGGIRHSEEHKKAVQLTLDHIDELKQKAQGKTLKKVKACIGRIEKLFEHQDSFKDKILHLSSAHPEVIEGTCKAVYSLHDEACDLDCIAERINELRNAFAHGDLSYDVPDTVLLDTIFLERVVLAMQMIRLDLTDEYAMTIVGKARQ